MSTREQVGAAARDLYHHLGHDDWEGSLRSVRAFYRSIARWHVERVAKATVLPVSGKVAGDEARVEGGDAERR